MNDAYSFAFESAVGSIASVMEVGGDIRTGVELRTVSEISALSQRQCAIATKTVGGSVAGIGPGDAATIWVFLTL